MMEEVPCRSLAEFIVLYWGNKVDCGIGSSYRPTSQPDGLVRQPYAIVNLTHPPVRDYELSRRGHYFYTVYEPFSKGILLRDHPRDYITIKIPRQF
jgi:hypothetical protein